MNGGFIYALKKRTDFLYNFPIFNRKHHFLDQQGMRKSRIPWDQFLTPSPKLEQILPFPWTVSLTELLNRLMLSLAVETQLITANHMAIAAYFPKWEAIIKMSYWGVRLKYAKEWEAFRATSGTTKSHDYFISNVDVQYLASSPHFPELQKSNVKWMGLLEKRKAVSFRTEVMKLHREWVLKTRYFRLQFYGIK